MENKAFTLIEILVVISIISLLSSVILGSIRDAQYKAEISVVRNQIRLLNEAIIQAQGNTGLTLRQITGSGCSRCLSTCYSPNDLSLRPNTCYDRWVLSVDRIFNAAGDVYKDAASYLHTDPWGNPFILDENEGESGPSNYCRRDTLSVVGPDNKYGGSDTLNYNLPYTGYGQTICNN